jgi:hypothetical protein
VRGRLSQFSTHWEKRTSDPSVLSIIRGIRTSVQTVATSVGVSHSLFCLFRSSQTSTSIRGSVCSVAEGSNITGSNFFPGSRILFPSLLGPQEKGGMRPVIDLSILNTYLVVPHFKMETNRSIRASILPGIWSTSLDLADAYFHCPISVAFRKYLRFVWDNKVFQFRAFPFGLAIAPLVFTKIVQVVSAHLHTLSIQIHSYLDDSLVKELNPDILLSHT